MNPDEEDPKEPTAPDPAGAPAADAPPAPQSAPAETSEAAPAISAEEALFEPATRQPRPPPQPPREAGFAGSEIPMPGEQLMGGRRARDARINLDLDLGRIKRRKRYGLALTIVSVLFVALVLAPVTWVGVYLFIDPPSTVLMMIRAAPHTTDMTVVSADRSSATTVRVTIPGQRIRHYPVPIKRMSPHIVRAVIAAEDSTFCTHDGFDVEAIQDAMQSNARGRRTRGASTISQQTAKNLFLWPERSWLRKGLETYFTALIEFMWPKRRVMEAYLNNIEWGDGNFGVEAAARARFGVSAGDLTPLQAARLAAVLPSPNRWRADNPGPYVRGRASTIVARAREVRTSGAASCVLQLDRPDSRR